MTRSEIKKRTVEDKFGRRYYCSLKNHAVGVKKMKRGNNKTMRRLQKEDIKLEILGKL